jgi:hypothetical protein
MIFALSELLGPRGGIVAFSSYFSFPFELFDSYKMQIYFFYYNIYILG